MNRGAVTVHPVKWVALEGTFFYAFCRPTGLDSGLLRGTYHAEIVALANELLLQGFQAILLSISNVHRVLLAANLPGLRQAVPPRESVFSQQGSNSEWNSI
jgi:hypothetical protein